MAWLPFQKLKSRKRLGKFFKVFNRIQRILFLFYFAPKLWLSVKQIWCKVGYKTLDQRFDACLKQVFLLNFASNLFLFCFLKLFCIKMLKMTIQTRVWGAQHPNSGQNIQHTTITTTTPRCQSYKANYNLKRPQAMFLVSN